MKYDLPNQVSGKWAKASELGGAKFAKIVSETKPTPSQFKDEKTGAVKMQDVARVQFQGQNEPLNVNLNRATIAGLIAAFGDDSVNWQNHQLSVETEKMRVGGQVRTALYLIPAGFKRIDDENGYAMIVSEAEAQHIASDPLPPLDTEDEIKPTKLPF